MKWVIQWHGCLELRSFVSCYASIIKPSILKNVTVIADMEQSKHVSWFDFACVHIRGDPSNN